MIVIPSIDLMGGKIVRLLRGDPKHARFYEHLGDPLTVAKMWESMGAQLIHVVDLDAALGRGDNLEIIGDIIRALKVPVQVGGGIRDVSRALKLVNIGAGRIIVGSMAFKSPEKLKLILEEVGYDRVVVALDHLGGRVVVDGWREQTGASLREAAEDSVKMGVKYLLVTSIQRDGSLTGPDVESLSKIIDLDVNIIASGGVRDIDDITLLRDLGVYGVVVGRALYEGRLNFRQALKAALG